MVDIRVQPTTGATDHFPAGAVRPSRCAPSNPREFCFHAISSACGLATGCAGHEAADHQFRKRTFE